MSSLVVKVTTIDEIGGHSNADALEIAIVGGWQCIVPKGKHKAGDKIVYFPPDTMLPREWADHFGVTKYLSFSKDSLDMGRIRCARLRGEPSFGLVVEPAMDEWEAGDDCAAFYGAERYEPPVRVQAGDVEPDHPLFVKYTDIENLRNSPDAFSSGEVVWVSEKVDGTNCRVGVVEGEFMAGSHRWRRKASADWATSTYWFPLSLEPVKNLLLSLAKSHQQVILFGEVYGKGVQTLDYGQKGQAFAAFDLLVDGRYGDVGEFQGLCERFGVPTVPIMGTMPYTLNNVRTAASGRAFSGNHVKEGVVVKPLTERTDPRFGRLILKYKSDEYLLGQKEDFKDV